MSSVSSMLPSRSGTSFGRLTMVEYLFSDWRSKSGFRSKGTVSHVFMSDGYCTDRFLLAVMMDESLALSMETNLMSRYLRLSWEMNLLRVFICCLFNLLQKIFRSPQSNNISDPSHPSTATPGEGQILGNLILQDTNTSMIAFNRQLHKQLLSRLPSFSSFGRYQFGLIKFRLPDLGEKIKEGTIKKLYVEEGDQVTEFQKLAQVASDKQFTEITAADTGKIVKIHFQEEEVCQVGDLFLEIQSSEPSNESSSKPEQPTKEAAKEQSPKKEQPARKSDNPNTGSALATPFVRGLIKKHNLDINELKGTGQKGRILESDVLVGNVKTKVSQPKKATSFTDTSSTVRMSSFEQGMQKSMTQSQTIPHLYLTEEIDITEAEVVRTSLKKSNKKVTVMGILIKTFSMALKKYPKINATYEPKKDEFEYTIQHSHNISIAIDSPNGLVVPNIKNVEDRNLISIQAELERLRVLSAEARLTSNELLAGTVCLSNIGTIGGIHANPLILPPQVCIVAIGKIQTVPKYIGDEVMPRKVINVTFGCDHRVNDGATVARFCNEWKQLLENPYLTIMEMV